MSLPQVKSLHYAWIMVIAATGIAFINGLPSYTFGLFLKPMATEFETGRAVISGVRSFSSFLGAVVGLGIGTLTDRYGPHMLLVANGILIGIGSILMSRVNTIWQIYLVYGVLVGVGFACYGIPIYTTIPRWFATSKEKALGFIHASVGLGGMALTPIVQWLISNYGWRQAFFVAGLLSIAIVVPLTRFMKQSPQKAGLQPYGIEKVALTGKSAVSGSRGITFRQAIRVSRFWLNGIIMFCFSFCLSISETQLPSHATDVGLSAVAAANIVALISGIGIGGKLSMGFLSGKKGARVTLCFFLSCVTIGMLILLLAHNGVALYTYALIFGFGAGGVISIQAAVAAELYGLKYLSVIYAGVMLCGTLGRALGPIVAGTIFDRTGSYFPAFLVGTILSTIAVVLCLILTRYRLNAASS
jgi:MFS family permease